MTWKIDLEWEEWWLELTDEQQEAKLQVELKKLEAIYRQMSVELIYANRRRMQLNTCLRWRKLIEIDFAADVCREHLKQTQINLLRLRSWRTTGYQPGNA